MYSINQITFSALHKHSLHDTYIQWTGETCINHTAATLVKTIDFAFLGSLALALKRLRMFQTKAFTLMGINMVGM